MRGFFIGMLLLAVLGHGCGQDGEYSLRVNFPSEALLEDTARMLVWVVDVNSCALLSWKAWARESRRPCRALLSRTLEWHRRQAGSF